MDQATIDFSPELQDEAALQTPDRVGFEIGWDHARHRLTPPPEHLLAGHPVREGWAAGAAVFGARTLRPRPSVRQWLQLRLQAWMRGTAFEDVQVTPNWLAQIDVAVCPVTGEPLTHGKGGPTDATVVRVNRDAGCAAGNLAVSSGRAGAALARCDWRAATEMAQQIEAGGPERVDGLDAAQWSRLAVLVSFATPLPHAAAAALPLLLLPPPRLRVLNPAQALQVLVTLRLVRAGQPARLDELARLFPEEMRSTFCVFATTLLARSIGAGPRADDAALRRAMEDAWVQPLVLQRWQRLALRLSAAQCEHIVHAAVERGLAGTALRCLSPTQATEGWALASGGQLPRIASNGTATEASPRRAARRTAAVVTLARTAPRPGGRLHG